MTRKQRSITLSIEAREKAQLEQLALAFKQTWGDKPNISKLCKAIASGKLRIAPNHDWSCDRITTLDQARRLFIDQGKLPEALIVAELLLERSELSIPLRQAIQAFVDRPAPAWRSQLDRLLQQQQPFQLTYQDAAERLYQFTIRYGRITNAYGDRQYLECWAEESAGNQDLPELAHNWCLRLDRIPPEANLTPVRASWRPRLPGVEVELHLRGGLAFAYEPKEDTVVNEWHPERPQVRRVVQRIYNSFWFLREIQRYGPDCQIQAPASLVQRHIHSLQQQLKTYLQDQ